MKRNMLVSSYMSRSCEPNRSLQDEKKKKKKKKKRKIYNEKARQ